MASHAGLVLTLKTKNGYIDETGKEVLDIKKAIKIRGLQLGFCNAYGAYQKLGFTNPNIKEHDIEYVTLEPSYDSRLGYIEEYLREMGMDYWSAVNKANHLFRIYQLQDYENFKQFIEILKQQVIAYYNQTNVDETIFMNGKTIRLHEVKNNDYQHPDYKIKTFYGEEGKIIKYSFTLKNPHIERFFKVNVEQTTYYNNWQNEGLEDYLKTYFQAQKEIVFIQIQNGTLEVYMDQYSSKLIDELNDAIRTFYSTREMHITRMFGSYILLQKEDSKLKAVKATPIPIKYCPLMIKLLKEVSGDYVTELLATLESNNQELQEQCMCRLINETVIKSGYFDTSRPLNSCEANVLFGASETMYSAFQNNLIDAAVIVSNNLGTIITTNASNTQGAVKRMTGLFYTTASKEIMKTATNAGIIPVFPISGTIDQLKGVQEAIRRGYKRIAVSVAANDNYLHKKLKELEQNGIKIYKFGLCSTGINNDTAEIMKEHADVVWSCASKYVKEIIEPNALAQVGIKIPVHIMTKDGWQIVRNHLTEMSPNLNTEEISLQQGEEKPIFINSKEGIKVLQKKYVHKCNDCPYPCI